MQRVARAWPSASRQASTSAVVVPSSDPLRASGPSARQKAREQAYAAMLEKVDQRRARRSVCTTPLAPLLESNAC